MVIWLLAGGGESELGEREGDIRGIVHFFEKHFPGFTFHRITPVRNKRLPGRVKPNTVNDVLLPSDSKIVYFISERNRKAKEGK